LGFALLKATVLYDAIADGADIRFGYPTQRFVDEVSDWRGDVDWLHFMVSAEGFVVGLEVETATKRLPQILRRFPNMDRAFDFWTSHRHGGVQVTFSEELPETLREVECTLDDSPMKPVALLDGGGQLWGIRLDQKSASVIFASTHAQ
jgi:hypothetical protein